MIVVGEGLLDRLRGIVGADNVVPGEVVRARPTAWQTRQPCNAAAMLLPGDTGEVSAVLAACHEARQPVVPYGGVTNLVQGCATTPGDLVLSLERMNAIEEIDAAAQTMTAQAGATMRAAQLAADQAGLFYPVDIGARDNCTLGGTVSTNAGGTKVIRYGMTRDCVLGLEAVLADGTVLSSMNRYLKNNSGFDLKQLFIGTEGQLGIVTRVVARLSVKPTSHNVALLACDDYADVLAVLGESRRLLGAGLCGFEVMWHGFYSRVTEPAGRQPAPVPARHAFYVLVESMGNDPKTDDRAFSAAMTRLFAGDRVADGVMAKSGGEREAIWAWVLALAGIAAATALWRSRVTPLLEAADTDRVARTEALRTTVIMVWAVIEAPALFAVVVYYLYDIPLAGALGVVLIWSALALTWPRRDWFDAGDRP